MSRAPAAYARAYFPRARVFFEYADPSTVSGVKLGVLRLVVTQSCLYREHRCFVCQVTERFGGLTARFSTACSGHFLVILARGIVDAYHICASGIKNRVQRSSKNGPRRTTLSTPPTTTRGGVGCT